MLSEMWKHQVQVSKLINTQRITSPSAYFTTKLISLEFLWQCMQNEVCCDHRRYVSIPVPCFSSIRPSICQVSSPYFLIIPFITHNNVFFCLTYITIFQSNSKEVINYDNVRVSFEQLGTLRRNDKVFVDKYVINAFCRKLFKDKKPKDSKRHYFFSTVGVSLCYSILHYPMLLCIIFLTPFCFSWTFYILLIFSASCTFYLSQFCVFYTDHIYKYMYIF